MKATMSTSGVITLSPESAIEAYALRHWSADALVQQRDIMRCEDCHWRGSRLIVDGNEPAEAAQ